MAEDTSQDTSGTRLQESHVLQEDTNLRYVSQLATIVSWKDILLCETLLA